MAETDIHRNIMIEIINTLEQYFRDERDVYVSGNLLIYYEEGNPKKSVAPDVFVVRGIERKMRRVYLLWEEGKGPDLVIEVTSKKTRREDLRKKHKLYEEVLKVGEYILFDPTRDWLNPPLQGYRLVGGRYERMGMNECGRLESEVLGLEIGMEEVDGYLRLRFYEPESGERIYTAMERWEMEAMARELAEERVRQEAEARRLAEERAQLAEERARQEAEARRLAEERVALEVEKRRMLEEQLERLRAELERLKGRGQT